MTQILAALTHDYVVVASDRQLTFTTGRWKGQIAYDNACKLVSLCGVWGIAYTGFSELQCIPTHKWIADRLAERSCRNPYFASKILAEAAAPALRAAPYLLEFTFLIAGWARLPDGQTLQPHFLLVSNMYDPSRERRPKPGLDFVSFERKLQTEQLYAGQLIGQPLPSGREKSLGRFIRRTVQHRTGPKPVMEAFVRELVNTSGTRAQSTVGKKVLAFSIPRAAAERTYATGEHEMLAMEPDLRRTTFCYFDPTYSEFQQYGPTYTCGEFVATDIQTQNDLTRDSQSSQMRIRRLPQRNV